MKRVVSWFVIATLTFNPPGLPCFANPTGGTVVGGNRNGTINGSGTGVTTINQNGNRVIINWQDFSIGSGEITRFIQPSANSWALNRVISANPSLIYGSLQANGHVLVLNQNGILVGAGGKIDTKGFVASTLDIRDSAFMKGGALNLSGNSTAGVRNDGTIQALGGDVFLIGNTVENNGTISAPQGTVGLAAGSSVRMVPAGNERISVLAGNAGGAAANGVHNVGTVEGASAELKAAGGNIYALAINNEGVVRANSIVTEGGHVYLRSSGGNIQNSGTISANKADGSGGTVIVDGGHNAANPSTVVNSGTIEARGDAAGTKGGNVQMVGDHVGLFDESLVDVSGDAGGGTALIGGDAHGNNPAVQDASRTSVGAGAQIHADAGSTGNGGKVVVWSDETTRYAGNITARGGGRSGNGGWVEVSGKENLGFSGHVDASAANGRVGTLLLDPKNVIVASGGGAAVGDVDDFSDPGTDVTIDPSVLDNNASITIRANNDITINDNINKTTANDDLTMEAGRNIFVNANITVRGNISLTANDSGATPGGRDAGPGSITMASGTTITANDNGHNISLTIDPSTTAPFQPGSITVANLNAAGDRITLTGGAAGQVVSELPGGTIISDDLLLQGSGTFTLGESGNNVVRLASDASGSVTYVDANALIVGTVGTVNGITSGGNAVSVTTINGNLTANQDINAGSSTVTLTAQSAAAQDNAVIISAGVNISGSGGIALAADHMTLSGTLDAGSSIATLRQFQNGTLISLEGSEVAGTLALSSTELNHVTAGILRIGDANSGNLRIAGAIAPANTTTLSLQSGGSISQITPGNSITVNNLALHAGTTITLNSANHVDTIAASAGGEIQYNDADALAIGSVDGLNGVLANNSDITISTTAGDLTVNSAPPGISVNAGSGSVSLNAGGLNHVLTIGASANVTGNGGVTLIADDMDLSGTVSTPGVALLHPDSNGRAITLGGPVAGTLSLSGLEINNVSAGTLKIGDGNSGAITINGAINPLDAANLSLQSGGTISEAPGGSLVVAGTTTLESSGVGVAGNITLDNTGNNFGTVTVNDGNDVTIRDDNAIVLGGLGSVSGDLKVTAGGNISESGALILNGGGQTATFTVTAT
jgi:filamentous hemagglutinin family protein